MTVRTRYAPSPTGLLHIGGVRTALYCWLYARRHGGTFVLRIEDTDRERSTDEAIQVILDGMEWLELNADEGPYYQTRRYDRYREVLMQFLDAGHAYRCYCTKEELDEMRRIATLEKRPPRYDGRCRALSDAARREIEAQGKKFSIRFKMPVEGATIVDDKIRGKVSFENKLYL